jgi:hypothetical protein
VGWKHLMIELMNTVGICLFAVAYGTSNFQASDFGSLKNPDSSLVFGFCTYSDTLAPLSVLADYLWDRASHPQNVRQRSWPLVISDENLNVNTIGSIMTTATTTTAEVPIQPFK